MSYGPLPLDGSSPVPFPMSSVVSPGDRTPKAVEGGGELTDNQSNTLAPVVVEDIERPGYISLTTPPAQTNAGTETVLTFSQQVNRVVIYNGTINNLNYDFDQTCNAGSFVLPPNYQLDKAKKVTTVHILTPTAVNINGSVAGGIIVRGSM